MCRYFIDMCKYAADLLVCDDGELAGAQRLSAHTPPHSSGPPRVGLRDNLDLADTLCR